MKHTDNYIRIEFAKPYGGSMSVEEVEDYEVREIDDAAKEKLIAYAKSKGYRRIKITEIEESTEIILLEGVE